MAVTLKLTRLPHLNDTIVIKQEGGHYFIAAENSFIIDKEGLIRLITELGKAGYLQKEELESIYLFVKGWQDVERRKKDAKNKKDSSNPPVGESWVR